MNTSDDSSITDTKIFTITSTMLNLVLSLPTNTYVVWLIATGAGGTLEAEFIPLNLAVFEIIFCLVSSIRFLNMIFSSIDFMSALANGLLWSGRPLLQCCICVEQFLAVVHPVLFIRYKPLRYKVAVSGLAWALIIGFSVFYTLSPSTKYFVFVGECVIVMLVMLFCYFSVLVALKRPGPGEGKRGRDNNVKKKAFFTILVIIVSFIGTYFFWCSAILTSQSFWYTQTRKILLRICTTVTFATGFVQPLIYLRKTGKMSCHKA